jgi:hypothetical protein
MKELLDTVQRLYEWEGDSEEPTWNLRKFNGNKAALECKQPGKKPILYRSACGGDGRFRIEKKGAPKGEQYDLRELATLEMLAADCSSSIEVAKYGTPTELLPEAFQKKCLQASEDGRVEVVECSDASLQKWHLQEYQDGDEHKTYECHMPSEGEAKPVGAWQAGICGRVRSAAFPSKCLSHNEFDKPADAKVTLEDCQDTTPVWMNDMESKTLMTDRRATDKTSHYMALTAKTGDGGGVIHPALYDYMNILHEYGFVWASLDNRRR